MPLASKPIYANILIIIPKLPICEIKGAAGDSKKGRDTGIMSSRAVRRYFGLSLAGDSGPTLE